MKRPTISFFCPAYYDEKNLPSLIPKTVKLLKRIASAYEIVIIEDASPDNTAKVADELAKKFKQNITVVHHKTNRDYGGALRSGFEHAKKYDYVFYTDGDNQFDVFEFEKFLPYIHEYDAVIGYRSKRSLTLMRSIQTVIYNMLVRLLFGIHIKDINCSIKVVKRSALNRLHLSSNSSFIDAEVIIGLRKLGLKVKEIEVTHYPRVYGKASGGNPKVIFHTIRDMMKFYLGRK